MRTRTTRPRASARGVVVLLLSLPVAAIGAGPRERSGPQVGICPVFPADNVWNARVDSLPVDPMSDAYVETIGASTHPHADFGSGTWEGAPIGIPYVIVPPDQPLVPIHISPYGDESDPGPYPVPADAPIEGGSASTGDRHVLVVREGECRLYELYRAFPNPDGSWDAASAAIFDLSSNDLRQAGWTSADAAGLPILPGLVRYDEVASGEIRHAIRFTAPQTRRAYVWPARHFASSSTDPDRPPMGQRFRLKAGFVIDDTFSPEGRVILRAFQRYGLILADNGSAWYVSGAPDERWDNSALRRDFDRVQGSDFEAIDVSSLMADPDSARVRGADVLSLSACSERQVAGSPGRQLRNPQKGAKGERQIRLLTKAATEDGKRLRVGVRSRDASDTSALHPEDLRVDRVTRGIRGSGSVSA